MKSAFVAAVAALAAQQVSAHATWQQLWVNGVDQAGSCVRAPTSNSPVTSVTGNTIRCNVNSAARGKCSVNAGGTVTIEMHQQAGDRSCASEAIGGAHYGPVIAYLSKVADSATADGSSGWFKIFENGWRPATPRGVGDNDYWGSKDLNANCGKMDVKIPADIAPGDYLLRAEEIALHAASPSGGAQFYISCYQLTVTGGGSASPPTVMFPGAYKASDPGIGVNIHAVLNTYIVPGPTVYGGGAPAGPTPTPVRSSTIVTSVRPTSSVRASSAAPPPPASSAPAPGGCTSARYQQCGGNGFTGCTTCAAGSTCVAVSPPYYSQCQ